MNIATKVVAGAALFSAFVGSSLAGGVAGRTVEITTDGWGNPQLQAFYNVRYNPDTDDTVWVTATNYETSVLFNARNDPDYFSCYLNPGDDEYARAVDIANSAGNGSFIIVSVDQDGRCYNVRHRTGSSITD